MQASGAKENAGDTVNSFTPSGLVPAQPDSRKSPSVHANVDAVSNTASGSGVGARASASSNPADPVANKDGADTSKPVFKAKKRQVHPFLCS